MICVKQYMHNITAPVHRLLFSGNTANAPVVFLRFTSFLSFCIRCSFLDSTGFCGFSRGFFATRVTGTELQLLFGFRGVVVGKGKGIRA